VTSTVVDAGLAVLLVGAATLPLVAVPAEERPRNRADAVARTVATTTATVEYALAGDRPVCEETAACDRRDHGTLAELLADAALRGTTVDGRRLSRAGDGYRRAVSEAVADALPPRTQVIARWEPYPGAHLRGRLAVGPAPPSDADVAAATLAAPSGVSAADRTAAVPAAIVEGLFPPARLGAALDGDAPVADLAAERYRRAARLYEVDLEGSVDAGDAAAANARLERGVARRVADDPRSTPGRLELDRVEIVVRTWGPRPTEPEGTTA